jgi:hypothetical protein
LYLTVLDPAIADFKDSARAYLDRADAILLHAENSQLAWTNVSLKPVADRPIFRITAPRYVTPELIDFVAAKLADQVRV